MFYVSSYIILSPTVYTTYNIEVLQTQRGQIKNY